MQNTALSRPGGLRSFGKMSASVVQNVFRHVRLMPFLAQPSTCTRLSELNAPAAIFALNPARLTALIWCFWSRIFATGAGLLQNLESSRLIAREPIPDDSDMGFPRWYLSTGKQAVIYRLPNSQCRHSGAFDTALAAAHWCASRNHCRRG